MNTYKKLLIILLLIALFVLAGVVNKTFNKDFFGNVSEWTMVLVTIITAYFLYETLNSQRKVQSDQEKINKLNTYQIRKNYKPNIEFHPVTRKINNFHFSLKISKNSVYNLKIISETYFVVKEEKTLIKTDNEFELHFPSIPIKDSFEFGYIYNNIDNLQDINNTLIKFKIEYQDEFKFNYSNEVEVIYNSEDFTTKHIQTRDTYL